jgi:hypothetical protein
MKHAIRKLQESQLELELNGTHQLLAYAVDVNLVGEVRSIKRKAETLIVANKEACLEAKK